jgi:anti-anti-sigma factor
MLQVDTLCEATIEAGPGLEVEQVGQVTVARILCSNLVDEKMADALGRQLIDLVTELNCRSLVVNLARVKRLTSSTLGKLIGTYKKMQPVGGRLVLCGVDPTIQEMIATLRLNRLFVIYPQEQEAVRSLA